MSDSTDTASGVGLERVIFFSDAVFAIVITLLVLPLTAEVELPDNPADWGDVVRDLMPQITTFVIGFLVIGQFWMAHHSVFGRLGRYNHRLLWLNLVHLLTVSFLPFPTAVLGADSRAGDQFPVVFYAASLTLVSLTMTVIWMYAVRAGLLDESLGPQDIRAGTIRSVVTTGAFLISVGVAFFGLLPAVLIWVLLLPMAREGIDRMLVRRGASPAA